MVIGLNGVKFGNNKSDNKIEVFHEFDDANRNVEYNNAHMWKGNIIN